MSNHPCRSCGACCNFFRVAFHWSETMSESHGVPLELTSQISLHRSAMLGTDQVDPRCKALKGVVGEAVSCGIYDVRPGCCRSFLPSFENGERNFNCEEARSAKGLKILNATDWL